MGPQGVDVNAIKEPRRVIMFMLSICETNGIGTQNTKNCMHGTINVQPRSMLAYYSENHFNNNLTNVI